MSEIRRETGFGPFLFFLLDRCKNNNSRCLIHSVALVLRGRLASTTLEFSARNIGFAGEIGRYYLTEEWFAVAFDQK